jgi:A/G-specific adenine glycosylase
LEAALAVPGVGLYTASAVLSIAFDTPLPVVDGNVRRVLSRLFRLEGPEWKKDAPYYNLAEDLLERKAPGDWNQALMELGATVCAPRRPACPACPLRSECRAREAGVQEQLPASRARRASVAVTVAAALVVRGERVLLVRRAEGPLLGRLWELPQTSLESRGLADLASEARQRYGLALVPGKLAVRARHTITFRRILAEGYLARLTRPLPEDSERYRWVDPDGLAALPTSSLTKKLIRGMRSAQRPLPL